VNGKRWTEAFDKDTRKWCDGIAALAGDALVDAGFGPRDNLEGAGEVISEEIYARLSVRDYPPRVEAENS
jgi:hypothetical protein